MVRRVKGGSDDGCMGRSRGGLTTKIHALVDADGVPIRFQLTAGQRHDGPVAEEMLDGLSDGASERGAWANIPPKSNRRKSFPFSKYLYKQRNKVERFFSTLKQFSGIATRYDKSPDNFLAAVMLASVRIWVRSYESKA